MKKYILYFIAFTFCGNSIAQQDYQITHYMFDNLSFNPGSAGMNSDICVTMIGRQQWSGFTGSPQTALINVQSPVEILRGGLGLTYISDQLGFEKNNIARLSYSYHLGLILAATNIKIIGSFDITMWFLVKLALALHL